MSAAEGRGAPERRAGRLLRWYPQPWRSRYGEEFTELLIADIAERPGARSRTADVIRGGILARLADAGLRACAPEAAPQARASLASLACCAAVFLGFGGAVWSQLIIGWQWSAPDTAGAVATFVMSAAMLVFAVLAPLAALPVVWTVVTRIARGRLGPSMLFLAGLVIVVAGGRHFGNGWPGTGGHSWGRHGLVPGGVAAFTWASTLSVSSFWAHPAALAGFPAAEFIWMAVSPLALAGAVSGVVTAVRRVELSAAVLRYQTRLAVAACVTMVVFLGGGGAWIADRTPRPGNLFHPGAIDVAGLVIMTLALAVGQQAARQARAAAR